MSVCPDNPEGKILMIEFFLVKSFQICSAICSEMEGDKLCVWSLVVKLRILTYTFKYTYRQATLNIS